MGAGMSCCDCAGERSKPDGVGEYKKYLHRENNELDESIMDVLTRNRKSLLTLEEIDEIGKRDAFIHRTISLAELNSSLNHLVKTGQVFFRYDKEDRKSRYGIIRSLCL